MRVALDRRSSSLFPEGLRELTRAQRMLEELEELPAHGAGALVLGDPDRPTGTVLMEHGRVCWAVAGGMKRRLSDLLRKYAQKHIGRQDLEEIYRQCKAQGKPLGEALVKRGVVPEMGLYLALRQHTAEAIALVASAFEGRGHFRAHSRACYDARFSFTPFELLLALGEMQSPDAANRARALAAPFGAVADAVLVLSRPMDRVPRVPLAYYGPEDVTIEDAANMGRWAAEALDLAGAIDDSHLMTGITPEGRAAVTLRTDRTLFVALCPSPSSLGRVLMYYRQRLGAQSGTF